MIKGFKTIIFKLLITASISELILYISYGVVFPIHNIKDHDTYWWQKLRIFVQL